MSTAHQAELLEDEKFFESEKLRLLGLLSECYKDSNLGDGVDRDARIQNLAEQDAELLVSTAKEMNKKIQPLLETLRKLTMEYQYDGNVLNTPHPVWLDERFQYKIFPLQNGNQFLLTFTQDDLRKSVALNPDAEQFSKLIKDKVDRAIREADKQCAYVLSIIKASPLEQPK